MNEKQTTLGEPMYVESLLNKEEWQVAKRAYSTYNRDSDYHVYHQPKPNPFKWRFGMGKFLSVEEVTNINNNLTYLLKKAGR